MEFLKALFQPLTIEGLRLRNRIVMPAMGTRFANENGAVTRQLIDYHVERAKGGVGLQIVEQSFINHERPACMLSVSDDQMIPGLNELVEGIHAEGGKVAIQIGSLGSIYPGAKGPDELSLGEIKKRSEEFIQAAKRCREAGFDAVEVHGAHRYLISQFLSPQTNHRSDEYGGNFETRITFLLEIIDGIRDKLGPHYPLLVRINGDGFDPEGLGLEQAKVLARKLQNIRINVLDISAGSWKSKERTVPSYAFPRGCHVYLAEAIKKEVQIPVIAAGRINDPVLADEIIREGKTDLVAMGRALLADPFLPEKARRGNLEDIRMCIACNYCHEERLYKSKRIKCAVNAALGIEREFELKPVERRKKVLVIGGGPAGMEAAWTLKMRGHEVALWEKETELGGQLRYAVRPPHKDELKNILQWLSSQVKKGGVDIHLGYEVSTEFLSRTQAENVILATGSIPAVPNLSGMNTRKVIAARDVLLGGDSHELGSQVIVIGAGRVGCETAEYVAAKKKKVTLIEKLDKAAGDMSPESRKLLLERLGKLGVDIHCRCEVVEIRDQGIIFYDREGREKYLSADSILLAAGSQPNDTLRQGMRNHQKVVYSIGDCTEPGNIVDAIHAGARLGRLL